MVYASDEYSCPNFHALTMGVPCVLHEMNMLLLCTLILFFSLLLSKSMPITLHYVICYITVVMCLFIITEKKERKRKVKKSKGKNQRK